MNSTCITHTHTYTALTNTHFFFTVFTFFFGGFPPPLTLLFDWLRDPFVPPLDALPTLFSRPRPLSLDGVFSCVTSSTDLSAGAVVCLGLLLAVKIIVNLTHFTFI